MGMDVPEDGLVEGDGVATDALGDNCVRVRWDMKGDELPSDSGFD